ncbi:transposase [Streptomyces sp. NPDC101249]|uniref:transposase n=1 Tax=Streptomyces sp. NPDC101249 TaxID=3366140 RepID=UPI00381002B2
MGADRAHAAWCRWSWSSAAGSPAGDGEEDPARSPAGQALGRSRGGLTTELCRACDGRGLLLAVVVTPGNVTDSTVFDTVMDERGEGAPDLCRAPPSQPDAVVADKAYSSRGMHLVARSSARLALREACIGDADGSARNPSRRR